MQTLTAEQRRQWQVDGYLHLEGVLNPDEVQHYSDQMDRVRKLPGYEPDRKPELPIGHYSWMSKRQTRTRAASWTAASCSPMTSLHRPDGPFPSVRLHRRHHGPEHPVQHEPGHRSSALPQVPRLHPHRRRRVAPADARERIEPAHRHEGHVPPDRRDGERPRQSHRLPRQPHASHSPPRRTLGNPSPPTPPAPPQLMGNAGDVYLFPHALWHGPLPQRLQHRPQSAPLQLLPAMGPLLRLRLDSDVAQRCTPRQRRLLGDLGYDFMPGSYFYVPTDQEEVITGEATTASGPSARAWAIVACLSRGDGSLSTSTRCAPTASLHRDTPSSLSDFGRRKLAKCRRVTGRPGLGQEALPNGNGSCGASGDRGPSDRQYCDTDAVTVQVEWDPLASLGALLQAPPRQGRHLPPDRGEQLHDRVHVERAARPHGRFPGHAPALDRPRHLQAQGCEVRLRHGPVRRLHHARGRRGGSQLHHAARRRAGRKRHHHRGARHAFEPASAANRLDGAERAAVRLLPAWADHVRSRPPRPQPEPDRGRGGTGHGRQHLPLRLLSAHQEGDPVGCQPQRGDAAGKLAEEVQA